MVKKEYLGVVIVIGIIVLFGAVIIFASKEDNTPGQYDEFAQCVTNSGAKFYGAFWCSHCKSQKDMFGKSVKLLPYVECSTADSRGQLQVCKDKGIMVYPTWIFEDGTKVERTMLLEEIASTTSCVLPNNQTQ